MMKQFSPIGTTPCFLRGTHAGPFLPLLYLLGASKGETPEVFNHIRNLGSISMTSYLFP